VTLTRRDLIKRGGTAAGALLVGAGVSGFSPPPARRLTGPAGEPGAARVSRLPGSRGTRLVHADLHNHTLLSDGDGKASRAYALMRDRGLDVAALTDHATGDGALPGTGGCDDDHTCGRIAGINQSSWEYLERLADEANDPSSDFVAIRGFEWSATTQGHINVWFSSRFTDPTMSGGQVGVEGAPGLAAGITGPNAATDAGIAVSQHSPGPGMAGFYEWLRADPTRPVLGGGMDGIAGFNHPGREPGRFGMFAYDPATVERIVSLEVINRHEDYLFKGVGERQPSPLLQCLDAGWRVGLIGVTDEHGEDAWGSGLDKGRAGLWVRRDLPYGRDAIKEALTGRRFFATNKPGLRLDLTATSLVTDETVRMGQTLAHRHGAIRFTLDIDGVDGERWAGQKPLSLQVLRSSGGLLPTIVYSRDFVPPPGRRGLVRFTLPLSVDDGDWVVVRVSDPAEPFKDEASQAAGTAYERHGRAVAYASPVFLDPDADAAAEAMRRERIAGVR
jgi:hypothetical protein